MNIPEIEAIIGHVEANPEEWEQDEWAARSSYSPCGTTMCIAGHAVSRAGYEIRLNGLVCTNLCFGPDGESHTIAYLAQDLLGLTTEQATTLFSSYNTLDDLKLIAKHWANGESCYRDAENQIVTWP